MYETNSYGQPIRIAELRATNRNSTPKSAILRNLKIICGPILSFKTSERLGWLEFRKGTPAWNSISAWAIKVSWRRVILIFCLSLGTSLTFLLLFFFRRRPPGFGFHKGDTLPRPGFRFGLLK
ncbi:unnamed protein product [Rhizophagus irregularis]|nr:unnamed protein product [Rhizophagus irregularis]